MPDLQPLPEKLHLATVGHFLRSMPSATADLMALARERAPDPTVFDTRSPAFWAATISTNRMDFYGTRMHDTTLANFATALGSPDSIAYQHSHDVTEYIGRSLAGEVVDAGGDVDAFGIRTKNVNGVFFTIPDIKLGSMGTTDFIDAIRAGVLKDVSVGFWADDIRCSICGSQLFYSMWWGWDGDCRHIPTMTYDVVDADGNPVKDANGNVQRQTCWGWVYNGELGETSSVYDGATPGAAVYKAQLMAEAGVLSQRAASTIEQRFRIRLPDHTPIHRGTTMTLPSNTQSAQTRTDGEPIVETPLAAERQIVELDADGTEPNDEQDEATLTGAVAESIELVKRAGFVIETGRAADVLRDIAKVVGIQRERITALDADAVLGRQYKADKIEEALKLGVRAKGDAFQRDTWEGILKRSGLDEIAVIADGWKAEGDAYLSGTSKGPGGRSTVENSDPPENPEPKRKKNTDHVYQG